MTAAEFWHYFRRYPYMLAKVCIFALVCAGLYFALNSVQSVLFPILMSLLIAYLLDPLVDSMEERGMSRTLAIIVFLSVGMVGLALFVVFLYPTIAKQAGLVVERLPQLANLVETRLLPWLLSVGVEVPQDFTQALEEYGKTIRESLPTVIEKATALTTGLAAKTGPLLASLMYAVMIPIFTFYFLRDFDFIKPIIMDLVPLDHREFVQERARRADEVVGAWFRGQIEVALILAVLYAIGLGVIFGVAGIGASGGIAIGLLTGILNIVPYFGVFIGLILSLLIVLLDWHGIGPLIGVGAIFLVVQLLEGYVITPRIVGEKVGLSPVVVIIVLLLGGEVLGLIGVLLAIPVAGIFRVLLPDMVAYYKESPYFTGNFLYELNPEGEASEDPKAETKVDHPTTQPESSESVSTADTSVPETSSTNTPEEDSSNDAAKDANPEESSAPAKD